MSKIIINGKWKGYYEYSKGYPINLQNKKFEFLLEIWNDDEIIKGFCIDDITKEHFNEPAKIEGFIENNIITFILTYPSLVMLNNNDETEIDPKKPSLNIIYTGKIKKPIFTKKYIIMGNWDISTSFLDKNKNPHFSTCGGSWFMQKN